MIKKSFKTFLYLAIFFFLSQFAYALNIVELSPGYYPNSSRGSALSSADIYVGKPDLDPEIIANQKTLSVQQEDGTITAVSQPIHTNAGGVPQYLGSPVTLLVEGDYSLKVLDSNGVQIYYVPSTAYEKYLVSGNYYYPDYSEADQGIVGGGNSVTDILADVGAVTKATMYFSHNSGAATTTYTFTTNTTITDNFNIIIEDGAILNGASILTIESGFEAGLYQIFGASITVSFTGGEVECVYPQWWGAKEGVGNDSATAINAAIAAGPDTGYTIKITHGVWEFQSQLDFGTKMHDLVGNGWGSILYANINNTTDAINIGDSASSTYGFSMRDIMVLGDTDSCQYTIKCTRTHHMRFENVALLAGAAQYALWIEGCIYNQFDITIHTPPNHASQPAWARPVNGIKVSTLAVPLTMQSNVNKFRVYMSYLTGNGFYLDGTNEQLNSIEISGSIEYVTGTYVIYAYNTEHLSIKDLYSTDGNTGLNYFENCEFTNFGPGYKSFTLGAGNNISLVNCQWTTIDQACINTLTIDNTTRYTDLGVIKLYDSPGIIDNGISTIYRGPIENENLTNDPLTNIHLAQDFHNYFYNSNFERWQSDKPDGWNKPATVTWTIEAGTVHNTTNSAKAVQDTAFTAVTWTDPDEANFLLKAKGKYISFGMWVYQDEAGDTAPSEDPYTRIRVVSAGSGNLDHRSKDVVDTSTYDAWVYHYVSAYVPSDTTDIQIQVFFDETIFIAEPCLMIGSHNQYGWVQEWNEHNEYIVIKGQKITFGAAAPAAGYWKQGDICFNTGAAAGGDPGWICITSGTPGTWKAMANNDA